MVGQIARADGGFADEGVKMQGQRFDPFGIAEGEVIAAEIEYRQQRAEDSDGGGIEPARVEEVETQSRVKLFRDF